MTIIFQHVLRLAKIENDYLKSILALLAKLNAPFLKEIFSQLSLNEKILMNLENPESRDKLPTIEIHARLAAIREKMDDWIKSLENLRPLLEELIDKQIDKNDENLTKLDSLLKELNEEEANKYFKLEDETVFLYELSVEPMLNGLHNDFSMDRQQLELALQDSSLLIKAVENLFEEYAENLNSNSSELIDLLQKLTSVIEVPSWQKKDIYLAVAKIEKHYLFKLLCFLMEASNSENLYLKNYYDFVELTSLLDTESQDSPLKLEDIMDIRHDMGLVHDTVIAALMSYGMAKKNQIALLSDVVEAKNNLQKMAIHEAIWLGYNFFDADKFIVDGARADYSFSRADREFKKSRSYMKRWLASIEDTEIEPEAIHKQLKFYEKRLIENLKSIQTSWEWFTGSLENKMDPTSETYKAPSKKRERPGEKKLAYPIRVKRTILFFDETVQKSSKAHFYQESENKNMPEEAMSCS